MTRHYPLIEYKEPDFREKIYSEMPSAAEAVERFTEAVTSGVGPYEAYLRLSSGRATPRGDEERRRPDGRDEKRSGVQEAERAGFRPWNGERTMSVRGFRALGLERGLQFIHGASRIDA